MNIQAHIPKTQARQNTFFLGSLLTLSALILGLSEGLREAFPIAATAIFNFVAASTPERIARVLLIAEVVLFFMTGVYCGVIVLRS